MNNAAPAQGVGAPVIHAAPPRPSYIPPFGLRTVIGCLGMLLAVHVAGFNEHVTEIGLSDIRGAMHIGHDEARGLLRFMRRSILQPWRLRRGFI